jgi:2-polyprenyl-3-methyl-5-hydroxy-6-metoxy-1,4-benzoquinol methylase
MIKINRNKCIVTGNSDLLHLFTFNNFPVFMGCVDTTDSSKDLRADMSWWISKKSGMIQMNPVPSLESIYPSSHGSGTVGGIWKSHHEELSKFILKNAGAEILEIGGGHGQLANIFLSSNKNSTWTLVDPNPSCLSTSRLKVIKGFFPIESSKKFDTIVHSHLFEHMINPLDFCNKIYSDLKPDGKIIFSIPNLGAMLERKYTNILNFEHSFLLNEYFVNYFLEASGFKIIQKEYFLEDHSIFYVAQMKKNIEPFHLESQFIKNHNLFKNYIDFHLNLISDINNRIELTNSNIYLFGAHVITQYLISFGIRSDKIKCILDNDLTKMNKRLNGTNLYVKSPTEIKNDINPVVILRAGAFQEEISNQLLEINKSVTIIS